MRGISHEHNTVFQSIAVSFLTKSLAVTAPRGEELDQGYVLLLDVRVEGGAGQVNDIALGLNKSKEGSCSSSENKGRFDHVV
jgi:hypothetical protein